MYDEFDNTENNVNQGEGGMPEIPETPETPQASENPGFYHYSYEQQPREPEMMGAGSDGPVPKKKKEKKPGTGRPLWKSFAVCTSLALVFGVVGGAAFSVSSRVGSQIGGSETSATVGTADTISQSESAQQETTKAAATTVSSGSDVSQVVKNTMPSIVAITNRGVAEVESMFFGQSYQQETESAGSGVIISENGEELLIATNNHVVDGAEELTVCFSVDLENPEDAAVEAQIKGTDSDHDLAVVAVNKADIPEDVMSQIKIIQTGDSDALEIGQQVIAIGNALGYGQSVTVGYVSALDREVTIDDITNSLIQTDAAINFGNSGGALLNAAGELIGINSAKAASTGVEGMGYAIPMATAQPILEDLMNRTTRTKVEDSERGYLGIIPRDVSEEAREVYNMPAGAFIYQVTEGSAAEVAGLKKGDIIVKLDGQSISSSSDLYDRMDYYQAGETIEVVVSVAQDGEYVERTVSVTLERKSVEETTTQESGQQSDNEIQSEDGLGNYGYGNNGESYNSPFEQLIP